MHAKSEHSPPTFNAKEVRGYRILLNISYTEHVTNKEVRNRIMNAIGSYEDLLTTVKRRKLKWYVYVSRSSKHYCARNRLLLSCHQTAFFHLSTHFLAFSLNF